MTTRWMEVLTGQIILPAGARSPSAGVQDPAGHRGRRPGHRHPGELPVAEGHRGQPGPAPGSEQLPPGWRPWDFFSKRQGRETDHGTCLFPFSGESRCPSIRPCNAASHSLTLHGMASPAWLSKKGTTSCTNNPSSSLTLYIQL